MESSDPWTPVTKLDEITEGRLLLWEEDGYSLLLTQVTDQVICFENVCPHLGWPLNISAIHKGLLICPHHGFKFDLLSGTCPLASGLSLRLFPIRVRDCHAEVQLSRVGTNGPN